MIIGFQSFLNPMRMYPIVCLLNKPFMFVASAIIYAYFILNEPSDSYIPSIHSEHFLVDTRGGSIAVVRVQA